MIGSRNAACGTLPGFASRTTILPFAFSALIAVPVGTTASGAATPPGPVPFA
jgi:hypothetical protein